MHQHRHLALVVVLTCLPAIVVASDDIDNLVVRANRTPQPVVQVGSDVSVIEREQIEQRKSIFVSDLLQDLPGIAVSRAGGFGNQTQVRIRGGEANHVLVLVDGVEANDPAASDEFSFEQLTAWDVERIEVVRGPQSALWGSDAMSGVINITTRRTRESRSIGAFAEGGSYGSSYYGAHLGSDLGKGAVDLSASAYETNGSNISRAGGENDGYENVTASLHARLEANEKLGFSLSGRYVDSTTDFDAADAGTGLPADSPLHSDVELYLVRAAADLELLDRRWLQQLQFTYTESARDNRDGRAANDPLIDDPVDYQAYRYGFNYQTSFDFEPEVRTNRLTLAVDHQRDEYEQRGPITFGDPNQDQEMRNTGLVAEYLLQPLENINLSASVRHDDNSDFKDDSTWRLAGTWRFPASGTRFRMSAGTGQKSPTFTERFGFFPGQFVGNPDLQSEKSRGYDVGIVQEMHDGTATAQLTYFHEWVNDEINGFFFDPVLNSVTAINQAGTSRRQGVEFALHTDLPGGLDARLSYTYTNAKQPDEANGGNRREIRRPRQMAALNLNYNFLNERALVNLNLSYNGKQKDDYFTPAFTVDRVQLDDYTLVDLVARYDVTKQFSMYARAENLLDENYENLVGYQAPGRAWYAGLRMRTN